MYNGQKLKDKYMFYQFKENILSNDMCEKLIEQAHSIGFSPSTVNMYGQQKEALNIRNNQRIEYTDCVLAKTLEKILLDNFPEILSFQNKVFSDINDHFRFYHYSPEEYFKPHKDGHIKLENKESFITCLFYLNDTEGGETILMPNGFADKLSWITIHPKKGSVLLFEHKIWHEGKPVTSGEKFVLRSDVFFAS